MTFGEQIKSYRERQNITQKQMGERFGVTRQTISNWENGVNLPDLEMLITIADDLGVPLDELIREGKDNDVETKLIHDRKRIRRMKINQISFAIGLLLLYTGIGCIWIKANSVEYIDVSGILHENFYLIPVSIFLLACGVTVFIVTGLRNLVCYVNKLNSD